VNFWTCLALALVVLWLQANAISCAGLQALRAEARVRWEALLSLERCRLERWAAGAGGSSAVVLRWRAVLEKAVWPEDASAVRRFFEERRLVHDFGTGGDCGVLELRCREAVRCYAEVAALYNARLPLLWGWPLSRWMGFVPVQGPPPPLVPNWSA
jgi:hypothetical protein